MMVEVGLHTVVVVVFCCLFGSGFSQDSTDINHGCYFDNSARVLTDLIICEDVRDTCHASCGMEHTYCESLDSMTIDLCRSICRVRNLKYYALEAGKQCFCGGSMSDPFILGLTTGAPTTCSTPCTGDSNKTCGGEFKMQVYEFQDPVPGADCFHPGFVPNAFISENITIKAGDTVSFICPPSYKIFGEAEVICQSTRGYLPNMLPVCNHTGTIEPTTKLPTTMQVLTTLQTTTAAQPVTSITDLLPYIIGGSAALLFLLVLCLVCICVCKRRKRSGNAAQNIRLKPESAPVTCINTGFHHDETGEEAKVAMPDILTNTRNMSSPPPPQSNQQQMSTFYENPIYENGNAARANEKSPTVYANVNEVEEQATPMDNPPSPIYANAEADDHAGYTKRYSGNSGSATTDRFYPKRGSSSDDPVAVYATENRSRAKKNGTGTKDLVGWSRPSSLYQRTSLSDDEDAESVEDNNGIIPNQLSGAIYAQINKNVLSNSRETLNSEHSGNSFFADPAKSSATRL